MMRLLIQPLGIYLFVLTALVISACQSNTAVSTSPTQTASRVASDQTFSPTATGLTTREQETIPTLSPVVLASGNFDLPAANAFGAPGFHESYTFSHRLPENMDPAGNMKIVIALWDASRPNETCGRHHPLSGCATVDWSDSPNRPKVPTDGVFNNSISLPLASGETTLYLSETGSLAKQPDAFDPGWPHTALGGSALEWDGTLPGMILPGGDLTLNLVLTKFGDPAVNIGYEIRLEPVE